jgi:hypothetical protein
MRRGDEIDVDASGILQFEHGLGQLLNRHRPAAALMTDVVVLAEDAAEIAARKENRPGASPTDQDALLAEMGTDGAYQRRLAYPAKARFPLAAMDVAQTRTDRAGIHAIP